MDTVALFREFEKRGASFVKERSFIDDALWKFEVSDADGGVRGFPLSPAERPRQVTAAGTSLPAH